MTSHVPAIDQPGSAAAAGTDELAQADPAPPDQAPPDRPDRSRRRTYLILLLLAGLVLLLIGFAIWYLLFRQPISELVPNLDLTTPPTYQSSAYGVTKPLGIAVTADGSRIYVTQTSGDQSTLVLDGSGNTIGSLTPPADVSSMATQLYLAIDPKTSYVFATDRTAGAIYEYAADGSYEGIFDPGPAIGTWQPLAIAFDSSGDLYVADVGGSAQSVHVFGPDGTFLRDLEPSAPMSFPNGIAVDADGFVYVADSNNGRLLVFDPTGAQVGLVKRGPSEGDLGMPRGVAVDAHGRVYVVDAVGQAVQMYRAIQSSGAEPTFLARFGQEGTANGSFEFPNGVAVDGRGRVYVADWDNDRIQVWSY
jgi:DNA-binding beta-propeller fold protein YncE